jgi:AbrB family looped-hinge helix DNA binding protein
MVFMNTTAPIDKAGRIVIPKAVRDALEIGAGDKLRITVKGEEIRLRVQGPPPGLVRKGKLLVKPATGRPVTIKMVNDAIEKMRLDRTRAILGLK